MRIFLLVAVLVVLPMQAQAQEHFWPGSKFVEHMREYDKSAAGQTDVIDYRVGQYIGYVAAAYDAYESAGVICTSDNLSAWHAEEVVSAFFKANPTRWNENAIDLVREALVEAFPCG